MRVGLAIMEVSFCSTHSSESVKMSIFYVAFKETAEAASPKRAIISDIPT